MLDLLSLNISGIRKALLTKQITAVELTKAYLQRAEAHAHLHAFTALTKQKALEQAVDSDIRIQQGSPRFLEGIPIGVKDIFCTKGILTTAGSKILQGFKPPYESTVTSQLFEHGAIMIGKTNMDEFAMGSSTTTSSCYPHTINPWKRNTEKDTPLVAGGSSGGSAAAVAARLCIGALGTDTGGSIRQPASFCGIVGIKPTYGRCSRWGIIAFSSSLDQAGILATNIEDAALILEGMSGYDPKDSTSAKVAVPRWSTSLDQGIKNLKVGIPKEYQSDDLPDDITNLWRKAIEWLQSEGAEIIDISLPYTRYALPVYHIIAPAEASSNLARYDGVRYGLRTQMQVKNIDEMYEYTRAEGFGQEVKRRIIRGTYILYGGDDDSYYVKAQKLRRLIYDDFQAAFKKVDAILTPTVPYPAFPMGDKMDDPIAMYLNDLLTVPASLAGLPALSVPAGFSAGEQLPLGLQLIGQSYDEETILRLGKVIEGYANVIDTTRASNYL
ncbi:Asp-tRNA(Asn)/Glu-tRNA(Gln) amidotransferase subunit GatA [Rickettsiales endosymbiont of Peranema trichophorum]|uniref:Asp-tRNA(Asn)/Glu-tRNA(Gln) amidotransferase subunit GatA n=1 Tax=Rickettsiales endosymbiont of Peranema trichophorum TaxID=2486577 RepID=UPI0010235275|nr:Asp-tRNA(Asn)/Glu-tRNA(Gln) amidotransferase subunit GatA [Rickettsiales endosymbiont of Peranema trichophorum]RZI47713.1 Asp-tRNA(Asn)/Glu-tRNA(Gln) amidotransferase subunit GatA [Rickettsiales endosymbiont of Peranema trichophorum]